MSTSTKENDMRVNIIDIMILTHCTESDANKIESKINELWLIDWSRDSRAKIKKAAIYCERLLIESGVISNETK